jgi:hypothetical protein
VRSRPMTVGVVPVNDRFAFRLSCMDRRIKNRSQVLADDRGNKA